MQGPQILHQGAVADDSRLDVAIARALNVPRSGARKMIEDGAAYVDGKRTRLAGEHVKIGQQLRVFEAAPDRTGIDDGELRVVLEDDWLIVLNKPAGLPTQPPPRGGDALSLRVAKHCNLQPGQLGEIHRLDRDVSGLIVYGLRPDATSDLAEQFRSHSARRRYLALVRTAVAPQEMRIDEAIGEIAPGRMAIDVRGMPAATHVQPLVFDEQNRIALVLCALETGRSHQVRVHLAYAIGPIVGDGQYGDPMASTGRIGLHSAMLQCRHPGSGRTGAWKALPGDDFWQLVPNSAQMLQQGWQLPAG